MSSARSPGYREHLWRVSARVAPASVAAPLTVVFRLRQVMLGILLSVGATQVRCNSLIMPW